MEKPLFSIIIPTLNEEQYVPKLLRDIKKQQIKNFEVIVVDGNSEDKTKASVLRFSSDFPLTFIQAKKRNISYQRNVGAEKATGTYFVFLDADMKLYQSFLKKMEAIVLERPEDLFIPAITYDDHTAENQIIANLVNGLVDASHTFGKPFSTGPAIIIARDSFKGINGFSEEVFASEDQQLVQKAYANGVKLKFLKNIKVIFSLRRLNKEGKLNILSKYFIINLLTLMKGEVKEKLFTYNMGGQEYQPQPVKE